MRLSRIFTTLGALAVPFMLNAVPADPTLKQLQNPDGTVTEGYLVGDEHFHYAVSADGNQLLRQDAQGFWKPAERMGRELKAVKQDINLLKTEMLSLPAGNRPLSLKSVASIDNEGRSTYPTIGNDIHALVVLIEYADTKFTVPDIQETIDRMCNEEGFSDYDAKGSARDYYRAVSGGKFAPIFDVMRPVTLSNISKYYVGNAPGSFCDHFDEAIRQSLTELHDSGEVDFSKYDLDNDGVVDNIYFFFAGYGQADTGRTDCIWPHQADYEMFMEAYNLPELIFDGKKIASYACSAELKGSMPQNYQPFLCGIGTFCHEYGHVLGLPDLYDTVGGNTQTPAYWDIMANGSYNDRSTCPPMMSAYERWLCRWIELEDAEDGTLYSLPASTKDDYKALRINVASNERTGTSEFFIIESRADELWDSSLEDHGLLIWHIDYDKKVWNQNTVNSNGKPHVIIMPASRANKQVTWPGATGEYDMTYPEMSNGLVPFANVSDFHIFLTDMKYNNLTGVGEVMYNKISDYPSDVVELNPVPELIEDKRRVVLSWTPTDSGDPDDEYRVTVKRIGIDGTEYIVDNMDDKPVGHATSVTVGNISPSAWRQDFKAFVRTVRYGIPAKTTSNVITFNPTKMISAVDELTDVDNLIIYCKGDSIIAPEGAHIYSVNGMELYNRQSLAPGMYIVKYAEITKKVFVQ